MIHIAETIMIGSPGVWELLSNFRLASERGAGGCENE
jgi:hypothetical protein